MRIVVAVLSLILVSCGGGRHVAREQLHACWLTESAPQSCVLVCAQESVVAAAISECNASVKAETSEFSTCMLAKKLHSSIVIDAPVSFVSRRTCRDLYPAEFCPSVGQ